MSMPPPTSRIDELVKNWRAFSISSLLRGDKPRAQNADDTIALLLELKQIRERGKK